jgi:ApbE superfamily uncharacterized protein (UPF0280 family)
MSKRIKAREAAPLWARLQRNVGLRVRTGPMAAVWGRLKEYVLKS